MNQNLFREILTIILAGGRGERLYPLTKDRSKPVVPFGGVYRIIDFTLSNCINSGLRRIKVLSQYMSASLDKHLRQGWNIFCRDLDEYLDTVPPQQQYSDTIYKGTADAIYQNIYLLEEMHPKHVLILSGDHIYKMNYAEMLKFHLETGADLTVAAVEVESEKAANQLGVLQVSESGRIADFEEKPSKPKPSPYRPEFALVNMGIYVFKTESLVRNVVADAKRDTSHDFGKNVIPYMISREKVYAYNFADPQGSEIYYWRDIGTIDSYYEASMDLLSPQPHFDLYDPQWPIRSYVGQYPPAKLILTEQALEEKERKYGRAKNSIISPGCVIDGAKVSNSILSPGVYVGPGALVEDSVILHKVKIGRGCRIRRAVIDKYVTFSDGVSVGYDRDQDERHFRVSPSNLVLIPKMFAL